MAKSAEKPQPEEAARFWRLPAVMAYTQRSATAIYRDKTFPKPVKLGPNTSAWEASAVKRWCDARVAESLAGDGTNTPAAA